MADKPKAPSAAAPPREAGDAPDGEGPSGGIDFITFVLSLAASTMIHLGEQEDGTPGPVQLPLAKQSIDIISMLRERTRGNLTDEESRTIEHVLYDLRIRYLKVSRENPAK